LYITLVDIRDTFPEYPVTFISVRGDCIAGRRKLMKSNRITGILLIILVLALMCVTFAGGFTTGRLVNAASASTLIEDLTAKTKELTSGASQATSASDKPVDRNELFQPFWQAWDLVHQKYVDQPVDDVALMRGAISGMLKALGDEHTSYLDPELTKKFDEQLNGQAYEGIGAWVDITGDYLKIISPMPDSPAEKAGLKSGDLVIAIDGEDMTGIDGELVRKRVLGPKGSTVILTIRRQGVEEPIDVSVVRDSIVAPTVESKMLDNNIAYVRLSIFGNTTADDLHKALKELMDKNPAGLVLDLRYNGGGVRDVAIEVASEFIPDGVIMYQEFGDGKRDTFSAKPGGLATKIPMVVLINEGSASASEIVAGAIQDRERGKLIGVTSYGKGSVQAVERLLNDQGEIRVTIARWLTPNGRQINKIGLTPDEEVKITDEDSAADRDPQLDKAIQLLLGQ
jgi:carboxyl-terminal processing protease